MMGLNDKGDFVNRRPATGAGEATKRKLPFLVKEGDLTEWSNQSLNQVIWTKDKIKELRREYTGITEKDGKFFLNRQNPHIVLSDQDVTPILKEKFKAVPPSIGYLRAMVQSTDQGLCRTPAAGCDRLSEGSESEAAVRGAKETERHQDD
jgi:hypothetical protein